MNATRTTIGATNLRMRFMSEKFKDSDSISDYVTRLTGYQIQLQDTDEALSDRAVVVQLLSSLPSKYEGIIRHIKDKPIPEQTIDTVCDMLNDHDRTTYLPEPLESQALTTQNRPNRSNHQNRQNYQNRQNQNNNQNNNQNCQSNRGSSSKNSRSRRHPYNNNNRNQQARQPPTCWYCTRKGHREDECLTKQKAQEARNLRGNRNS